jgi:predicted  nucleic acid-binding Zn-ribbon protein
MDTNAIINAAMQQLVTTVADEVIRRLKAESSAEMALDADALAAAVLKLMQFNTDIREEVRCVSDEHLDGIDSRMTRIENDPFDINNNEDFVDLKSEVDSLKEQVEELQGNSTIKIDSDDTDFADAVRQVIRDNI